MCVPRGLTMRPVSSIDCCCLPDYIAVFVALRPSPLAGPTNCASLDPDPDLDPDLDVIVDLGDHRHRVLRQPKGMSTCPSQTLLGPAGFFKGVGKGVIGAVAQPLSGGLDFASSAFEGIDATKDQLIGRPRAGMTNRRLRLPRAIGGDGKVTAFIGTDGTEKQVRKHITQLRCQSHGFSSALMALKSRYSTAGHIQCKLRWTWMHTVHCLDASVTNRHKAQRVPCKQADLVMYSRWRSHLFHWY